MALKPTSWLFKCGVDAVIQENPNVLIVFRKSDCYWNDDTDITTTWNDEANVTTDWTNQDNINCV